MTLSKKSGLNITFFKKINPDFTIFKFPFFPGKIPGFLSTYSLWDKHRTSSVFVLEKINMTFLKYTWGQLRTFHISLFEREIHSWVAIYSWRSLLAFYFSFGLFRSHINRVSVHHSCRKESSGRIHALSGFKQPFWKKAKQRKRGNEK